MAPTTSTTSDHENRNSDGLIWTIEQEISLFHAMRKHKPVGVTRHFQMACLHDKMNHSVVNNKTISTKDIWSHLRKMYDLAALNESEITPFPNKQVDFALPSTEFGNLMRVKGDNNAQNIQDTAGKMDKSDKPAKSVIEKYEKLSKSSSKSSLSTSVKTSTPDNSPKRKRTRQTPNPSPAVGKDEPTPKRLRRT
ncbi:uncharacterized protein LOC141900317 [Tubulanus polymorphus]|uniref:uncharacterized protein LOC141900317 n=1 Tax=Tubulanus polymorphus TaxID=672921 RepID=UPI003DA400B1